MLYVDLIRNNLFLKKESFRCREINFKMALISEIIDQITKKTLKPEEGIIKAINEPGLFSFNELIYSPCLDSV